MWSNRQPHQHQPDPTPGQPTHRPLVPLSPAIAASLLSEVDKRLSGKTAEWSAEIGSAMRLMHRTDHLHQLPITHRYQLTRRQPSHLRLGPTCPGHHVRFKLRTRSNSPDILQSRLGHPQASVLDGLDRFRIRPGTRPRLINTGILDNFSVSGYSDTSARQPSTLHRILGFSQGPVTSVASSTLAAAADPLARQSGNPTPRKKLPANAKPGISLTRRSISSTRSK
jgi:hypothetical protein